MRKFRYSEIFGNTFQGEGKYTGIPTVWIRFWGCNFNCDGFGQPDPTNKSTWILDYQNIDVNSYKDLNSLPVFKRGCDSSYSWSKKFFHLAKQGTAKEIVDEVESFLRNEHNPEAKFLHSKTNQWTHMAFTGGEPMLSQTAIIEIMEEFKNRNNVPPFVTVETNGTQRIRKPFSDFLNSFVNCQFYNFSVNTEWFWSVSPKLYLSGEKWEDSIKPEVLKEYYLHSKTGQLKFVVDGSRRAWYEVEKATELYRKEGITWNVWIMPVGSTEEDQRKIQSRIAEEAIKRGYNFSSRLQCFVFGNVIGK